MDNVDGVFPEVVSSKVVGRAPLTDGGDNVMIDSVEVSPLSMTRGGLASVMAGAASLAVAEVASSADFAGVASPADLAGMALPAVAGAVSPADLAGMAIPAVAGLAPLAVVEVASSSNLMEAACSPSGCSSRGNYGGLVPDDCVTIPDVVVLPDSTVLGDPTVAVLPAKEAEMSGVEECCGDRDLACTREQPGATSAPWDRTYCGIITWPLWLGQLARVLPGF